MPVLPFASSPSGSVDPLQEVTDLARLEGIWRAGELAGESTSTLDTGYAQLDAVLPGGGWPLGGLIEILQPQAGLHEWGLLAPAWAGRQARAPGTGHAGRRASASKDKLSGSLLVLVGAPYIPFGPALAARQLCMDRLLCVQSQGPSLLWATREALQCADVAAVAAWLPDARSAHLRRLQIAAHAHNKLLFVFRPLRAQLESSPAPLRLLLQGVNSDTANLQVKVLKRRGPPLDKPVLLGTRPPRLSALLAASRERARQRHQEAGGRAPLPMSTLPTLPAWPVLPGSPGLPAFPASASVASSVHSSSANLPAQADLHALLDRIARSHHH